MPYSTFNDSKESAIRRFQGTANPSVQKNNSNNKKSGSINIKHRECQGREAAGLGEVRQRQTEVWREVKEGE